MMQGYTLLLYTVHDISMYMRYNMIVSLHSEVQQVRNVAYHVGIDPKDYSEDVHIVCNSYSPVAWDLWQ